MRRPLKAGDRVVVVVLKDRSSVWSGTQGSRWQVGTWPREMSRTVGADREGGGKRVGSEDLSQKPGAIMARCEKLLVMLLFLDFRQLNICYSHSQLLLEAEVYLV